MFDPELEKWGERPPRAPPCRINNHTVQGTRHNGLWWITVPWRTGRHNRENLIEHFSKPSTSRPRRGFHLLLETSRLRPIYISTKGTSIPYRKRASIVRTSRRISCNFQRVRQNRNPLSNAGPPWARLIRLNSAWLTRVSADSPSSTVINDRLSPTYSGFEMKGEEITSSNSSNSDCSVCEIVECGAGAVYSPRFCCTHQSRHLWMLGYVDWWCVSRNTHYLYFRRLNPAASFQASCAIRLYLIAFTVRIVQHLLQTLIFVSIRPLG